MRIRLPQVRLQPRPVGYSAERWISKNGLDLKDVAFYRDTGTVFTCYLVQR